MKTGRRMGRFGVLGVAVIVTMLVAGVFSNAAVTISTPNSSIIGFSLAPGGTSAAITPATDTPLLLMGMVDTPSNFSICILSLVHIQSTQIRWIGLGAPPSGAITQGGTTTPGSHVAYLDQGHQVDLEVLSADAFVVHNGSTKTQTGKVKLIW